MSGFGVASSVASSSRRQLAGVSRVALSRPTAVSRGISTSTSQADLAPASSSSEQAQSAVDPALVAPSRVQLLKFPPLTPLPRPYGIHVASLQLASHHPYPLDLYTAFSLHAAHSLGIPTSGAASLPTTTSLWTVLKSPFVHKKAQENFERRIHRRVIKVWDADRGVLDLWLRYLKKHGLGGVGMRAEVFEWVEPGQVGLELRELEAKMMGGSGLPADEIRHKAEELVSDLTGQSEQAEVGRMEQAEADGNAGETSQA